MTYLDLIYSRIADLLPKRLVSYCVLRLMIETMGDHPDTSWFIWLKHFDPEVKPITFRVVK